MVNNVVNGEQMVNYELNRINNLNNELRMFIKNNYVYMIPMALIRVGYSLIFASRGTKFSAKGGRGAPALPRLLLCHCNEGIISTTWI